jgi:hypothetical protein
MSTVESVEGIRQFLRSTFLAQIIWDPRMGEIVASGMEARHYAIPSEGSFDRVLDHGFTQ